MHLLKNLKFFKHRPVTIAMDGSDSFRNSFKFFKHKKSLEDLCDVLDFEFSSLPESVVRCVNLTATDIADRCNSCAKLGLFPHNQWHIYSLKGFDGFMYIKNPFTSNGQKYWIRKSLELYPRKPAVTNLDRHYKNIEDVWSLHQSNNDVKSKLIDKLTWATLGYHYNWDAKVYDPSNYSHFPECLADLAKHITSCLSFKSFNPDTAIVNYYNNKSTLGIHNDNSEDHLEAPIVSLSFGLTAIFLLGTNLKTDKPVPILLRSGDVVILSGVSRTCYHAVPSVISEAACNRFCVSNDDAWKPFHQYIEKHRINISVRQAYCNNVTVTK